MLRMRRGAKNRVFKVAFIEESVKRLKPIEINRSAVLLTGRPFSCFSLCYVLLHLNRSTFW